ncbi:MAG TPA: protease complex subunit PrcB family protein [Anaerolineae bacterium]
MKRALFRGDFGSSGYDAIIQRVTRQGDHLVVQAQFWAPSPYYAVTAAESQPHDVVKVLRDGGPLEEAELVLETQALTPTPPPEIRRLTPTPTH